MLMERVVSRTDPSERHKAERLREVTMVLLIFILEHQFISVVQDDVGEGREPFLACYYQVKGIGIGSSASTAIANLTLLFGERIMLRRLWNQGIQIKSYVRYIDDIYLAAISNKKQEGEIFRKVQKELDNLDSKQGSVRVEGKQISMSLVHDQGVQEVLQVLEF
jgi:hypothetical protein